jgi:hypothetical protein
VDYDEELQHFSGAKAHAEETERQRPHIANQERASLPRRVEATVEPDREGSADVQNINRTEDVEPTLSDDEGYTG